MLFLLYIGLLGSVMLVVVSMRFSVCIVDGAVACGARQNVADYILGIFLLMLAILFVVFVCIMGVDQLRSLVNEESYIDRLKREQETIEARARAAGSDDADALGPPPDLGEPERPRRSWLQKMERAFGSPLPSRWWWLVPTDPGIGRTRWYVDQAS